VIDVLATFGLDIRHWVKNDYDNDVRNTTYWMTMKRSRYQKVLNDCLPFRSGRKRLLVQRIRLFVTEIVNCKEKDIQKKQHYPCCGFRWMTILLNNPAGALELWNVKKIRRFARKITFNIICKKGSCKGEIVIIVHVERIQRVWRLRIRKLMKSTRYGMRSTLKELWDLKGIAVWTQKVIKRKIKTLKGCKMLGLDFVQLWYVLNK
jgi:hypothetical protein